MNKKLTRKLFGTVLILFVIAGSLQAAFAIEPDFENSEANERYVGTVQASVSLSQSGGNAICNASIKLKSGYTGTFFLRLLCNGSIINTWRYDLSSGDSQYPSEQYAITHGNSYQLTLSGTVRNSNGRIVDRPYAESSILNY